MFYFFFFNDTATTEIYTLSLHDALPISCQTLAIAAADSTLPKSMDDKTANTVSVDMPQIAISTGSADSLDRKSTRLNSSHSQISYAVFCLKKQTLQLTFSSSFPSACRPP